MGLANTTPATPRPPLGQRIRAELMDWAKTLAWIIPIYLAFTTVAFANYSIPSESMVPSLEVGDRVAVSKFAYGYSRHSLPLDLGYLLPAGENRLFGRMPQRGDVVVFAHPHLRRVLIKRLVGLPGDRILVRGGRLWVNGAPVELSEGEQIVRRAHRNGLESVIRYQETLPGGLRHPIHLYPQGSDLDEFGPYIVPPGHFFFMGDNRGNSADSRTIELGAVPFDNLIGRAEIIYFASNWFCSDRDGISCPRHRWMRPLRD